MPAARRPGPLQTFYGMHFFAKGFRPSYDYAQGKLLNQFNKSA
jgi:hypothetical protein